MMLYWNILESTILKRGDVLQKWSYLVVNGDLRVGVSLIERFDLTDVLLQRKLHHSEHHWHLRWQLGELQLPAKRGGEKKGGQSERNEWRGERNRKGGEEEREEGNKKACVKEVIEESRTEQLQLMQITVYGRQTDPFDCIVLVFSLGSAFSVRADLLCDILQELF